MSWKLIWSPPAREHLLDHTGWLADRNPEAALRFVGQVVSQAEALLDHPHLGPIWDLHPAMGVRRLVSGKHLIYYEVLQDQQAILVLTVRHSRERVPELDAVKPDPG
jgi:plasmid stabilization system protein ParE